MFFNFNITKRHNFFTHFYMWQYIFVFYNLPVFLLKPIFYIKFMASHLLIPLIIQRQSTPWMYLIAISLKFIDISIHHDTNYRHSVETKNLHLKILKMKTLTLFWCTFPINTNSFRNVNSIMYSIFFYYS